MVKYTIAPVDNDLACGDEVVVPAGNSGKQSVDVITNIELFTAEDAPLPLTAARSI